MFKISKTPTPTSVLGGTLGGQGDVVEHYTYPNLDENPQSYGRDVNIINIVREHGPKRIAQILKELEQLEEKRRRLSEEHATLERLVEASK